MFKRFIFILIAPLCVLGCGEEPTVQRYEVTEPVGYDWPVTEQREAEVEVDGLTWVWEVPAGWMDAPEVPDQLLADYRFRGSTESLPGRLTVSKIDGDAGGINANVMRWLGQLYVTTPRGPGPEDKVEDPLKIPFGFVTYVELHGQYQGEHNPTHLFAAIVQIPDDTDGIYQTWFFKMVGDEATVDARANRLGLAKMVFSLRPKGSAAIDLSSIDEREAEEEVEAEGQDAAEESTDTP
jgi:hypothetical protein